MKCPKDFDQHTLTEIWFGKKRSISETNIESSLDESSENKKFKTPRKISPRKSSISNATTAGSSQRIDIENDSDDNDFVQSSQDTHKSKLRNKIDETLEKNSKIAQSTPQKSSNCKQLCSPNKKLDFSEVCEVSSTVIKEEIVEMLDDMENFESIEMTHNLSDLLVNSTIFANSLDCTSPMKHLVKLDSLTEDEDANIKDNELKDPLHIEEKTEEKEPAIITKRKNKIPTNTVNKNELKKILPIPKKLSTKKESHRVVNKKSANRNLKIQKNKAKKIEEELKTQSLSDKLLKVLKTLKVQLQHEVPPQHMIENSAGARNLEPKQIAEFEKYGPLKRGAYSKEEDEIIKKNWQIFCEIHNWNTNKVEPFLYMRHEGKYYISSLEERKNFVRFLANGLPWRSLYSVHYRFRNIYNSVNNGPYTAKEDKKILAYMSKTSCDGVDNKCAELAKLLHRKRQSIWTRYQKLKINYNLSSTSDERKAKTKLTKKERPHPNKICSPTIVSKQVFRNVKWTSPLVKKFIHSIMEVTDCNELVDLKNQKIDRIVWRKMQKNMSIHRTVLQDFWYLQLHMQLFCPTPIYLNDTKVNLIEHMYAEKLNDLEEVNWESICIYFNGMTPYFLSQLFEQLLKCARKTVEVKNLSDGLEYLHKNYVPMLIEKSIDAVLPKIFYRNGKIIGIDKGSEKKIANKFTTDPFCDELES